MKKIYLPFLAITFFTNISIAQDEDSGNPQKRGEKMPAIIDGKATPVSNIYPQISDEILEEKRAKLGELERLAVSSWSAPSAEDLAPYRFQDTSRLQQMLKDKDWVHSWSPIMITIATVANKKDTLWLIDYIRDSNVPTGYERVANEVRLSAIGSLSRTTIDQDIPEVIDFLKKLTDKNYVKSLNFSHRATVTNVRQRAFLALGLIGSDESIAILEKVKQQTEASLQKSEIQPFSTTNAPDSQKSDLADDLSLLKNYLKEAHKRRAEL